MKRHVDIVYPAVLPFVLFHLSLAGVIFTGLPLPDLLLAAGLFALRMFAITAGYHRYFSHRSFRTSRWFQFLLAFLSQTSAQQGVIYWSAVHRHHHKYSDTEDDPHSPRIYGFFYAHVGWIFDRRNFCDQYDYSGVKDLLQYPELRWLDRHRYLPAVLLGVATFLLRGLSGFFVGFVLSTVVLYHATFAINSLAHGLGRRRFFTGDESRNNWLLALLTFGEGWHNNHHYFPSSARQGFRWYEVDLTYGILKLLEKLRLVWELKEPPARLKEGFLAFSRERLERARALLREAQSHADPLAREALKYLEEAVQRLHDHPLSRHLKEVLEDLAHSLSPYALRAQELLEELKERLNPLEPAPQGA